jgi:hypothetical protein
MQKSVLSTLDVGSPVAADVDREETCTGPGCTAWGPEHRHSSEHPSIS